MRKAKGTCLLAAAAAMIVHCAANAAQVEVDNHLTELVVADETELTGAGGVILDSLEIPAGARLVLDPIATPIFVTNGVPVFGEGASLALSADYAGIALGRVVLMTYVGTATVPDGLFDSSCVSGAATLSQRVAPDGTSTQLVLTVGDYDNEAKDIRIAPIGDSISHGYKKNIKSTGVPQYAQYRTGIAARLAANGFRPVMLGARCQLASTSDPTCDAAGVRQPDEWIWHSGVSGDAIMTAKATDPGKGGGVRDNLHLYLDIAGKPDVITLLIGSNDFGNDREVDAVFIAYTNLVWEISRQRPDTKIVASTILTRSDRKEVASKIELFNGLLLENLASLPGNYALTNLHAVVDWTIPDIHFDKLHPTAKGFAPMSKGFAAKIMEVVPFAAYSGPIEDSLTDEPQTALGAATTVPASYRSGMTHVFTIDSNKAANSFYGSAPYTATNSAVALGAGVKRAGYYMELVRAGTNRRRFVWVDFDATGKTLDDVDFPWTGNKFHQVVTNLHVYSNDSSIHNIPAAFVGYRGVVEATSATYYATDGQLSGLPADMMRGGDSDRYGWNDTLDDSGPGYGCFQVHRLFSQTGEDVHWNDAEVLLAWNRWSKTGNDDIGIGTFANNGKCTDYTATGTTSGGLVEQVGSAAYQVRHLEIWVEQESGGESGAWMDESAAKTLSTGSWSQDVAYGADGRASICDNAFTPVNASTGNVVTVEVTTQIVKTEMTVSPDAGIQAAVRLSTNGCFQAWVGKKLGVESGGVGESGWVDVEAEGITPENGAEYTLRFTFDYTQGTYSVAIKNNNTWMPLHSTTPNSSTPNSQLSTSSSFPLAFSTNCVSEVAFTGLTRFTSLYGECEMVGFGPGELTLADAKVIIDAAKAAWLNNRGSYSEVSGKLAALTKAQFDTAYLCNLEITNDVRGVDFRVTGLRIGAVTVEIDVTLTRTGAVMDGAAAAPINGVLRFYGADAIAAFKSGTAEQIDSATFVNGDFGKSDTATATFDKDGNLVFNAKIEASQVAE